MEVDLGVDVTCMQPSLVSMTSLVLELKFDKISLLDHGLYIVSENLCSIIYYLR